MDQNTRASGHPIDPDDEGESTQIFGQKMNAIFSSLAPPAATLPPPDHDLSALLDDDLLGPRSSQLPPATLASASVGRLSSPGLDAPLSAPRSAAPLSTAPLSVAPLSAAPLSSPLSAPPLSAPPTAVPSAPDPVMADVPLARLSAPLPATASASSRRVGWVPALVVLLLLGVGVLAWGYLRAR